MVHVNPISVNDHVECYAACNKLSSCKFFTFRNGNECVRMKEKAQNDPQPRHHNPPTPRIVSGSKQDCSTGRKFVYLCHYFMRVNLLVLLTCKVNPGWIFYLFRLWTYKPLATEKKLETRIWW